MLRSGGQFFLFLPRILVGQSGVVTVVAAAAAPSTVSGQIRFFVSSTLVGCSRKVRDCCGSRGHGCLELCSQEAHTRCGPTGATPGALRGSTPGGLARVHRLPMLDLLGRSKTIVDFGGVTLGLDIGHLVKFLLRN